MPKQIALEDLSTEALMDCWSDAHKDLHGFRPRYEPTREDLISFWSTFVERMAAQKADEAEEQARCLEMFVGRIRAEAEAFAVDERTAMRWEMQAEGLDHTAAFDVEHYFYNQGIGYHEYTRRAREWMEAT